MLYNYCTLFLLFIIYSVIGYIVEVINVSAIEKKLVLSRGFLIGPYLPIYGIGAVFMTIFLEKYQQDFVALFIMGTVLCSALEYFTSLIMEKIFKLRWWDYSDKRFNINGRVCLENGVLFGLGGVIIVKIVNPFIEQFIYWFPSWFTIVLGITFTVIFVADLIESIYIMFQLKLNVSKYTNQDSTMEIKREVKKSLSKNTTLINRLVKSFPNINNQNNKGLVIFRELLQKTRQEVKKLRVEYKEKKNKQKKRAKK